MSDRHRRYGEARRTRSSGRSRVTAGRVVAVLLIALVASSLTMTVTPVSYVNSGSMEPGLSTNDGFLAVPAAVAGPPAVGDVIVYRSEVIEPGKLVTHRVVDRTSEGYVTQGDANPITDQRAGEPPVERDRVVATVVTVGGDVVAIPRLGHVAGYLQALRGPVGGQSGGAAPGLLAVALAVAALSWRTA